jgi:hypothetical protein
MNKDPFGPKTRFPHPGSPNAIFPINLPEGFQTYKSVHLKKNEEVKTKVGHNDSVSVNVELR